MNCPFDKEKLTGYYDGELDAAEKAEVEHHIAACSECLRDLGELKSAALLIKELPRLRAPRSIAEGVKREMQTAGKVHRFASFRKNLMWVAATAAALLVVLNVAYFGTMSKPASEPMAASQPVMKSLPSVGMADAAPRSAAPQNAVEEKQRFDETLRRGGAEDRALGQKPAETELRKNLAEGKPEGLGRGEADSRKPAEAPKPLPLPPGAPPPSPEAKKPEVAAPVIAAAKEAARPSPPAPERAAEPKKDADFIGKAEFGKADGKADEAKAKKAAPTDPAGDAPVHLTFASMQMAKARPQVEETLRKLGVAVPAPAPASKTSARSFSVPGPEAYTLEMTDSQIARLRQEIEKQSYSRLVVAAPGDPVLVQYGDAGMLRGREKAVVSGGAAAPSTSPAAAPAPAPAASRKPTDKSKDEVTKETEDALKAGADKLEKSEKEKGAEPRRKVVLHLLEVMTIPDAQPAPDPVKK